MLTPLLENWIVDNQYLQPLSTRTINAKTIKAKTVNGNDSIMHFDASEHNASQNIYMSVDEISFHPEHSHCSKC